MLNPDPIHYRIVPQGIAQVRPISCSNNSIGRHRSHCRSREHHTNTKTYPALLQYEKKTYRRRDYKNWRVSLSYDVDIYTDETAYLYRSGPKMYIGCFPISIKLSRFEFIQNWQCFNCHCFQSMYTENRVRTFIRYITNLGVDQWFGIFSTFIKCKYKFKEHMLKHIGSKSLFMTMLIVN